MLYGRHMVSQLWSLVCKHGMVTQLNTDTLLMSVKVAGACNQPLHELAAGAKAWAAV